MRLYLIPRKLPLTVLMYCFFLLQSFPLLPFSACTVVPLAIHMAASYLSCRIQPQCHLLREAFLDYSACIGGFCVSL